MDRSKDACKEGAHAGIDDKLKQGISLVPPAHMHLRLLVFPTQLYDLGYQSG